MDLENRQLHVVFGRSAAGTLQHVLETHGVDAIVVGPYDDFSFGPIDQDDAETRAQWVEHALGYEGWRDVVEDSLPALSASRKAGKPPIAWVSPDSPRSLCGFLWWLSHMEGRECRVLDVPKLGLLGSDAMREYLGQAAALSPTRRARSVALWRKLQAENAPLRVLGERGLMSAPLDYFDPALLSHVKPEWQKMALIVGRMLSAFDETGAYQTCVLVLAARLGDLAESGRLEWRGDLSTMARCEIRLPA